jgi:dihydrofolate reductase
MRKLSVFNHVTLDGYFVGANGDMSWAHKDSGDAEWSAFVAQNAGGGGVLVFGRITYQMMESYWPTPMAKKNDPGVAERMNALPKVVFSRTLASVSWSNTTLVKSGLVAEIRKLKAQSGLDLVIMGSGTIVAQLAPEGLIDEYQVVLNPTLARENVVRGGQDQGGAEAQQHAHLQEREGPPVVCAGSLDG